MKIIAIYGPPGVGKLTVAQELEKLTGYKLMHNHLAADFVGSIFAHGTPTYKKMVVKYRTELLKAAARAKVDGVIFTFMYRNDKLTNSTIINATKSLARLGAQTHFVQLYCEKEELYKRVVNISRRRFDKITDLSVLKRTYEKHNLFDQIPFAKSLSIDNTNMPAKKAAILIAKELRLK